MRVLVWTQYFWPENFGINDLVLELKMQGVDVTVLTGKPNYPEGKIYKGYKVLGAHKEFFKSVEILRIPLLPRGKNSGLGLFLNYLSFVVFGCIVAPFVLRGKGFDAVFVYAPSPILQALPALFVSKIKRAPLVLWVQDLWPEALQSSGAIKNRYVLKIIKLVVRYIYRGADSILIQSEEFRERVERLIRGGDKISYYPNSVKDFMSFPLSSPENPDLVGEIDKTFSVVFTGNIGFAQSCETVLRAAELLQDYPKIKFFLIGRGSDVPKVYEGIQARRLKNVEMPGELPVNEMAVVYSAASVLLITLRGDDSLSATIPSKLQSYLAAGKPIVACINGAAARVVQEAKAGIVCSAEDAQGLSDNILRVYGMDEDERAALGNNGRKYFEANFGLTANTKKLISHFCKVGYSCKVD